MPGLRVPSSRLADEASHLLTKGATAQQVKVSPNSNGYVESLASANPSSRLPWPNPGNRKNFERSKTNQIRIKKTERNSKNKNNKVILTNRQDLERKKSQTGHSSVQ